jgi:hypothetical protein
MISTSSDDISISIRQRFCYHQKNRFKSTLSIYVMVEGMIIDSGEIVFKSRSYLSLKLMYYLLLSGIL